MDPGAVCVAQVTEKLRGELGEIASWEELRERRAGARVESDEEAAAIEGFVGSAEHFVSESLDGFAAAHPDLVTRLEGHQVIVRRHDGEPPRRVAVLSGGGAGHEPMHAGFVGEGMLDAACPGAVFTSPSPDGIRAATEAVDAGAGVLHIVKQYTGDVLNFRLAGEIAAASGIEVATVIVDDDVAIAADSDVGRRGTGVTIVAEKIAGAAAAEGQGLHEVAALARKVVENGRSYGVAIHGSEMEIGVGIHGEPGVDRVGIEPVDRISARLLDPILDELDPDPDDSLLVLLSGLGGTPPLQLYVLFEHLRRELEARGLGVARSLVGDLITSLEQAGAVLSVVVLDAELARLWDAPAKTPALHFG
ncbi:dihydroxyacetone kinase [Thermoleophilia bacterium SCSIO 60948]|nr:dihydroxyacetone kinase [Thermoleophilia bacterium SCSIO 60948]